MTDIANGRAASGADELVFLPLGGSNEIGMNFNLYGYGPAHARRWVVVDLGITFGDVTTPGVEVITPDPRFAEEVADEIEGIVLTHAHEDHIGAIGWLWERIRAPIYATPFTAFLVREKLREHGLLEEVQLTEIPLGGRFRLGPFDIELVTLTHSVPEPSALAIRTPLGMVLHTGDWKIDPDPIVGAPTDPLALRALGDEGVLAMTCDSTNVFVDGTAGSEAAVRTALTQLIGSLKGKIAVGCFASNVARMDSVIRAAEANDRRVCLQGRSMHRITAAAKSVGLLQGIQPFVSDQEAGYFPDDNILYLCTGSQGEPRAALSRIADGTHPHVTLGKGDHVIFSSRQIPGNEVAIRSLQNRLTDRGVRIHTEREHPGIHVSGHPCRDELRQMYQWVRPTIALPTHGERRHANEHVALALEMQTPQALAARNGEMVRIAPGRAEVIDEVPSGVLYVDGGVLTEANSRFVKERRHAAANGVLFVAVTLDGRNRLAADVIVKPFGLPGDEDQPLEQLADDLGEDAERAVQALKSEQKDNDAEVEQAVARTLKRAAQRIWDRRPAVEVIVTRL